jgi:transglutaminase-like putative cysteine protease
MKLAIRYSATYRYGEKASLSPHIVRLFPRQNFSLQTDRIAFSTHASADVQKRQDLFDNLVANCFFPAPLDTMEYRLELDITLEPRNPFHFLLDSRNVEIPFAYTPEQAAVVSPYLQSIQALGPLPADLSKPAKPVPTVDFLNKLNFWLHENIAYERRDEGEAYAPDFTLQQAKGSCRDFAVLMAELLRHHGLATRLVSGFLWEDETEELERRAENALHAWIETYLPGAGWVGLDPTNGVFCDHHFIPTAVGLTPAQIAPVAGHYYGQRAISSNLDTTLTVQPITL